MKLLMALTKHEARYAKTSARRKGGSHARLASKSNGAAHSFSFITNPASQSVAISETAST